MEFTIICLTRFIYISKKIEKFIKIEVDQSEF